MKYCQSCNHPADDNAAFCTQCGTPFAATTRQPDSAAYTQGTGSAPASGQTFAGIIHQPWFPVALMALALFIMWNWNVAVGLLAGVAAAVLAVKSRAQLPKWALYGTYIMGGIGALMLLVWIFG